MTVAGRCSLGTLNRNKQVEQELLTCCYCQAPLEAVVLGTDDSTGDQRFFWACKNMRKKTCYFPIGMPNQMFWSRRTAAQRQVGFFPKPAVHLLPPKFRHFYPTFFAESDRTSKADTRCATAMSSHTTDTFSCATSMHTSSSSGSSISSDSAAVEQLLNLDRDAKGASIWGGSVGRSSGTRTGSSTRSALLDDAVNDGKSTSAGRSSSTTYSSSEGNEGAIADAICDQLHNMGVDASSIEDKELIKQMSSAVRTLRSFNRGGVHRLRLLTPGQYRASVDYLFNLDVTPIKRRLNVISTDLTRAVAVMRSECSVDTMLDAMGGNTTAPPVAKRARLSEVKQELKKRVEAVLKKLAEGHDHPQNEESTSAPEVTSSDVDPSGAKEWYHGEDGPSVSTEPAPATGISTSLVEEERLNAIIQKRVRSHVANSAARRHAYRRKRLDQSEQVQQQTQHRTGHHVQQQPVLPLHVDVNTTQQDFSEDDGPLSFESPYLESFGEDSSLGFAQEPSAQQPQSIAGEELSISHISQSNQSQLPSALPTSTDDNLDFSLFDGYEFLC